MLGEISIGLGSSFSESQAYIAKWEDETFRYHVWISNTGELGPYLYKKNKTQAGSDVKKLDFTAKSHSDKRQLITYMINVGKELKKAEEEAEARAVAAELAQRNKSAERNREHALRFVRILDPTNTNMIEKITQADLEQLEKWEEDGAF